MLCFMERLRLFYQTFTSAEPVSGKETMKNNETLTSVPFASVKL